MLTQHQASPEKHSSASGSRISVWLPLNPHPTQQCCRDVVTAPARRCNPLCRFESAAEWKLCRAVVNSPAPSLRRCLKTGRQNPRDEEACWPFFKEWLKGQYVKCTGMGTGLTSALYFSQKWCVQSWHGEIWVWFSHQGLPSKIFYLMTSFHFCSTAEPPSTVGY